VTFTLHVAGIATRVICDEATFPSPVSGSSSRFLGPEASADVTIRAAWAPGLAHPEAERLMDAGLWRLYREDAAFIFSFVSPALGSAPYRIARFNGSFSSGQVWLNQACRRDDVVLEPLDYPLDELLMINLLGRGRGVEVHGCGVVDEDGSAYLCAGQSGAGKSTIARLWHGQKATILSDDRLVLRLRDRRVWMYGTPWHGEQGFACPAAAPLSRIFFLQHGLRNDAQPVNGARAAARLFACSFPPFHDKAGLDFTLALLAEVVDLVPAFELTFAPDARVVDFVRRQS
jgi:hypothetical protein